jgi:hypothetical protein
MKQILDNTLNLILDPYLTDSFATTEPRGKIFFPFFSGNNFRQMKSYDKNPDNSKIFVINDILNGLEPELVCDPLA